MHSEEILSTLYSTFDKTRLDPILTTFKSNELLYDFYHTRIFEIITETLSNAQSQAISALSHENTELTRLNSDLQQKLQQLQSNYTTLSNENKTAATAINHIEQQIKSKDETNQSLSLTVTQLETQNAMLHAQIEELKNENKNNLDKINELISVLNAKEKQINFFKQNLQQIKTKQHELTCSLNEMIEQNYELKNELDIKNNDLSELVNKIEELKLEFQKKRNNINKEVDMLRNENENVLKVKIQALKNKLREKIAIINKLTSSSSSAIHDNDDNDMHYSDSLGRNLQYQMTTAGNLLYD